MSTRRREPALTGRAGRRYDVAVNSDGARARPVRCPRCATAVAWSSNPHRPFCSLTCRLIDLGVWLDERYRIAGPELADDAVGQERVPPGGG
jgi:endogenous inhibitor of DNA gyrase (YacG/DUF329 family)